jgi:hypothetical protein
LDRLSYLIRAIHFDSAAAPIGHYRKLLNCEIRRNKNKEFLDINQA